MSSQIRVDPFQIRPESGLGGRWPIKWLPGTAVEGGTPFWPSSFRVYLILAIAHKKGSVFMSTSKRLLHFLTLARVQRVYVYTRYGTFIPYAVAT